MAWYCEHSAPGDGRVKQIEQHEHAVLVEVQLTITRFVSLAFFAMKTLQQREQHVEVFQSLNVLALNLRGILGVFPEVSTLGLFIVSLWRDELSSLRQGFGFAWWRLHGREPLAMTTWQAPVSFTCERKSRAKFNGNSSRKSLPEQDCPFPLFGSSRSLGSVVLAAYVAAGMSGQTMLRNIYVCPVVRVELCLKTESVHDRRRKTSTFSVATIALDVADGVTRAFVLH